MNVLKVWVVFPKIANEGEGTGIGVREEAGSPGFGLRPFAQLLREHADPRLHKFPIHAQKPGNFRDSPHNRSQPVSGTRSFAR